MPYEADVDIVRHLTFLAHLLYSAYAASSDVIRFIPHLTDILLSFGRFVENYKTE